MHQYLRCSSGLRARPPSQEAQSAKNLLKGGGGWHMFSKLFAVTVLSDCQCLVSEFSMVLRETQKTRGTSFFPGVAEEVMCVPL